MIIFIHRENGRKHQKYIIYNESAYYTIFKNANVNEFAALL